MPSYMFLLHDDPTVFEGFSPEEMQRIIGKYQAWGETLRAEGRFLHSHKLKDREGRVLRRENGGVRVLDGPYSETKEAVGGYFAVSAESYDEAVRLAEGCPHIEFGTIEIREIHELP